MKKFKVSATYLVKAESKEEAKNKVGLFELLSSILHYYTELERMSRLFHWNVKGEDFVEMHDFFGEEYDSVAKDIDDIAEHIRQLGLYVKNSKIAANEKDIEFEESVDTNVMLAKYKEQLTLINNFWKELNSLAEDTKHIQTIDLAGEMSRKISKTLWKVDSMLNVSVTASTVKEITKAEFFAGKDSKLVKAFNTVVDSIVKANPKAVINYLDVNGVTKIEVKLFGDSYVIGYNAAKKVIYTQKLKQGTSVQPTSQVVKATLPKGMLEEWSVTADMWVSGFEGEKKDRLEKLGFKVSGDQARKGNILVKDEWNSIAVYSLSYTIKKVDNAPALLKSMGLEVKGANKLELNRKVTNLTKLFRDNFDNVLAYLEKMK